MDLPSAGPGCQYVAQVHSLWLLSATQTHLHSHTEMGKACEQRRVSRVTLPLLCPDPKGSLAKASAFPGVGFQRVWTELGTLGHWGVALAPGCPVGAKLSAPLGKREQDPLRGVYQGRCTRGKEQDV